MHSTASGIDAGSTMSVLVVEDDPLQRMAATDLLAIMVLAIAMPASTALAADDNMHPPDKAMDSATPKMKNPEGTEGMHPPQKAMDNAALLKKCPRTRPRHRELPLRQDSSDGSNTHKLLN